MERKRQLQQRSRQKGTATQERWLFPFSCKRKVVYAMFWRQLFCPLPVCLKKLWGLLEYPKKVFVRV